jgi:aminopeptidase YwaD
MAHPGKYMAAGKYLQSCNTHILKLCVDIPERSVGSAGNRAATSSFENSISSLGWATELQEFDAMDWIDGGASLSCGEVDFQVFVSPYSLGCETEETLVCISSLDQLENAELTGQLVLLHGEIAMEQLMPKGFVFYNPEEHQRIIALLERGAPQGIICATGRNASLAGGVYPFPLIEDGDFDIPSVYMTEEEGRRLLEYAGVTVSLNSVSRRVPGKGCNVSARKGSHPQGRIVITAHIDAKKGTPGAMDNASGVVILLLLAEMLKDYQSNRTIELVALNGEDYYAVPGQMHYIQQNQDRFHEISLNINIDGAGYKDGPSAFSFYNLPDGMLLKIKTVLSKFEGITEGAPAGPRIFIQYGCPAVAVSSHWFTEHIDSQEITHTNKDNIDLIDCEKLVEIAYALEQFIRDSDG